MSAMPPFNKSKRIIGQSDSCCALYEEIVNDCSISMLNEEGILDPCNIADTLSLWCI